MIIYKTTNSINGKIYIGKDKNEDPTYFGSGLLLRQAIQKYGKSNFKKEVLEKCKTEKHLCEQEKYWIKLLGSSTRGIGYNISEGGSGGDTFSGQPENKKTILREKFKHLYNTVIKNTPKFKTRGTKISRSKRGVLLSDSHKKSLSLAHLGKIPHNKGKSNKKWSDCKKYKITESTIEIIIKLYEKYPPRSISRVLYECGLLNASDIVIRRVLRETGTYRENDNRFRVGKNWKSLLISQEEALNIARAVVK